MTVDLTRSRIRLLTDLEAAMLERAFLLKLLGFNRLRPGFRGFARVLLRGRRVSDCGPDTQQDPAFTDLEAAMLAGRFFLDA